MGYVECTSSQQAAPSAVQLNTDQLVWRSPACSYVSFQVTALKFSDKNLTLC
jgi:hypothetical protein